MIDEKYFNQIENEKKYQKYYWYLVSKDALSFNRKNPLTWRIKY